MHSRRFVRGRTALLTAIAGLVLASLALNLVLHLSARTGVDTTWTHVGRFLHRVQGADSWKPMETARAFTRTHATGLYEQVFFTDHVKFQYPPTALLFFGVFERPTLNLISWFATLVTAGVVAVILRVAIAASWGEGEQSGSLSLALDALVLVAALTFYPFIKAYSLGQIQAWLNLLFALVILAWMRGRLGLAGVALGLICLVKPTYALLYVWGALRREWRFVAAGAFVAAAGLALSLWRYGLHDHLEYPRVLSYIAQRGEAFYANQSINGVLNRLLFNGSNLEWHDHAFPPVHPLVYIGTLAGFALLFVFSLRHPQRGAGGVVDLSVVVLAATLTAPVAWEHHYGILLPIYAAVTPSMLVQRPFGRWTAATIGITYLLAANYVQFTNHFADSWLNLVQSYLLAAAVVLWALLYRALHASSHASSSVASGAP